MRGKRCIPNLTTLFFILSIALFICVSVFVLSQETYAETTTIGNGTDPGDVNRGPGETATMLDAFTLMTSSGTDTVSNVTVTLSSGASGGLSYVQITNDADTFVYGSVSDPASDTVSIPLGTSITATTTETQYKVRIYPKSHTDMPAPPGSTYTVTGTVTAITSTYTKVYNDTASATITIDNQSPANHTGFSGTPNDGRVRLDWTNPGDPDYSQAIVLRREGAPVTDTPVEGIQYVPGNAIGSSVVACMATSTGTTCTSTGLTNGTTYYFKIFAKDTNGNYSSGGAAAGPYTPGPVVTAKISSSYQISEIEAGTPATYIGAPFMFQQSSGTPDTITALTITDTGTAVVNTKLANVRVYYESDVTSCSYDGSEAYISTSFDVSEKIVLTSISIPVTLSTKYTCIYVVFDVDLSAVNGSTVDLEITSSDDFILSGGSIKDGTYPVDLRGMTYLYDKTPPGNITGLTVTPGAARVTFNWTNPSDADFAGVRIRRSTSGSAPASCSVGTLIADVAAPATSFTNTSLTNGTTYYYRLCSYDEVPRYSTGVTASATPSDAPLLSYPAAPYDDGKDPNTGYTTTDFTFKVIYTDWQNDAPASGYPKIYIGDNDGYANYAMSLDSGAPASLKDGNYTNGEQYVYGPVGLGAAQDVRFYFEAQAATGNLTVSKFPTNAPTGYIAGPTVYLLLYFNMVGVPKDLGAGLSYTSVLGDDTGYTYCIFWDSLGLDTVEDPLGDWSDCASGNIEHGKGYYILAETGYIYRLDEPGGVGNVIAASVDIALDPDGGWTMISNPYNAHIELQNVTVVRSAIEYTFSNAVTNGWIGNSIYEWEGDVTGYTFKAYNGTPPAILEPWVGYFIYVYDDTTPLTLRVYKP
jgi:hypothetical protein